MKIRSVIIDDESHAISVLSSMISDFCPELEIVGNANSVATGKALITNSQPDLVFLDINMVDGYGFEVLKEKYEKPFEVIFTTAYSEFAVRAFKYAAIHYLLKPIDPEVLQDSIKRYQERKVNIQEEQFDLLKNHLNRKSSRIVLQDSSGFAVYELSKIVRLESHDGYTFACIEGSDRVLVSQSLSYYEELLVQNGFCRVHAKHLINLSKVNKFVSMGRNGSIKMSDGAKIDVSVRRKDEFVSRMKEMTLG